ncbi:MAG: HD domain-containing protein [Proteobacteria bacterium]|nr:HD domain-containing protein [Pseudomonadota bacterium]
MSLTRQQAWELLTTWTETTALRKHARAVEIVMRAAAVRYGEGDQERWGMAGMLHDADYEKWPQSHPQRIVRWLEERNEPEVAYAISGHFTKWGVPARSQLDRALVACDELTGFVVACCLVRPDGVHTLTAKSVKKKLKDKAFAAKVDRGEVRAGAEALGVDLTDHVSFVIEALKPHAEELGISGKRTQRPA